MNTDRITELRAEIDELTSRLLALVAERQEVSVAIGSLKLEQGLPLYSEEREAELLQKFRHDAVGLGLDPDYIEDLMRVVLEYSRAAQRRQAGEGR
ncbi:MAG: chorismate mutase [Acidimicrobiia bacterium]